MTDGNLKQKNKEDFNNSSRFVMNYFNVAKWHFGFWNYSNDISSVVLIFSFMLLLFQSSFLSLKIDNAWATPTVGTTIPVYMITTRDASDPPQGEEGTGYDGRPLGNISKLKIECPSEIAIFVHGWGNDNYKAKERLDRLRLSLIENNHTIPLVGLSWPSNTTWNEAKIIAKQDGPKLGHFIMDYFYDCKHQYDRNVNVRLISHSLGGRVILSALDELHNNMAWRNEGFKILSVHLMGAAVDDEEVSKNPSDITDDNSRIKSAYGEAIQAEVIRFYNLHNPKDNMLQPYPFFPDNPVYNVYPFFENDTALGQAGRQQQGIEEMDKVSTPPYYDINVTNEIERGPDADGLADMHPVFCGIYFCNPTLIKEISIKGSDPALCLAYYVWGLIFADCRIDIGDNHGGYMGFRDNPTNRGIREYDGAIDVVVQHWLTPLN